METRQPRQSGTQGFTLIEVMIVVAIVGVLSALAVPQYLRARSRAQAAAVIGQALGIAKECATGQISGLLQVVRNPTTGLDMMCDGVTPPNPKIITVTWEGDATGVKCLTDEVSSDSEKSAQFRIVENGGIECEIPAP